MSILLTEHYVGLNQDTTVAPFETIIYKWKVDFEGIYFFSDLGNPLSSEKGTNLNGLFGALFVEPRVSWWTDPETGKPMNSGVYADVHHPILPSFREYAWIFHDEMEVDDLTGIDQSVHITNQKRSFHGANYRYEPMKQTYRLIQKGSFVRIVKEKKSTMTHGYLGSDPHRFCGDM